MAHAGGAIETLLAMHTANGTLVRGPRRGDAAPAAGAERAAVPGKIACDAATVSSAIADTGHHRMVLPDGQAEVLAMIGTAAASHADGSIRRPPRSTARRAPASGRRPVRRPTPATTGSGGSSPDAAAASRRSPRRSCARPGTSPRSAACWWSPWPARTSSGRWTSTAAASVDRGRRRGGGTGDGPPATELAQPSGLAPLGTRLGFVDAESSALRALRCRGPTTWSWPPPSAPGCSTGATPTASARSGRLQHPLGLAADGPALDLVADTFNHRLRALRPAGGVLDTRRLERRVRRRPPAEARFDEPSAVAVVDGGRWWRHQQPRPAPRRPGLRRGHDPLPPGGSTSGHGPAPRAGPAQGPLQRRPVVALRPPPGPRRPTARPRPCGSRHRRRPSLLARPGRRAAPRAARTADGVAFAEG